MEVFIPWKPLLSVKQGFHFQLPTMRQIFLYPCLYLPISYLHKRCYKEKSICWFCSMQRLKKQNLNDRYLLTCVISCDISVVVQNTFTGVPLYNCIFQANSLSRNWKIIVVCGVFFVCLLFVSFLFCFFVCFLVFGLF